MIKKLYPVFIFLILTLFLNGCGIYKRSDVKDNPTDVEERVRKNIEEGRGLRFSNLGSKGGTFDFASSNEMWRASIEVLDFVTFTNASYSGGIIITDWFSSNKENNQKEIKITVRFLSNEIRADSLKITVHQKNCNAGQNCIVKPVKSKIEEELLASILRNASLMNKNKK